MLLYRLILINFILDITAFWFPSGGINAVIRLSILLLSFFYLILKGKIKFHKFFTIIIFIIYVLVLVFWASDPYVSLTSSLKIIFPFLMLIIGYVIVNSELELLRYLKQFKYIFVLIIFNTVISNFFGLGVDDYTKQQDYVVGALKDSWNTYTYTILLLPLLLHYEEDKIKIKRLNLLGLIVFVLLLLSLKRIAILGVVVGFSIYYYKVRITSKQIKNIVLFFILLLVSSPFYIDLLESRFNARMNNNSIVTTDGYKNELRYLEFSLMYDRMTDGSKLDLVFFGENAFDSRNAFGATLGMDRQLHVDYMNILYTIGIVGFFFYLAIYRQLFLKYKRIKNHFKRSKFLYNKYKVHLAVILTLLLTSLFTSLAGQMYHITFRGIVFMTIGGLLGLLTNQLKYYGKK